MMLDSDNPFAAPQVSDVVASEVPAAESWKAIARRWELLRIAYNVLLAIMGLIAILPHAEVLLSVEGVGGIVVYAIGANVFYSLGPLAEMYLNWLLDGIGHRLPAGIVAPLRSPLVTYLLFAGGLLFSLILTLVGGYFAAAQVHAEMMGRPFPPGPL